MDLDNSHRGAAAERTAGDGVTPGPPTAQHEPWRAAWIEDEARFRDEGAVFGLADSDAAVRSKEESIRHYFAAWKARVEAQRRDLMDWTVELRDRRAETLSRIERLDHRLDEAARHARGAVELSVGREARGSAPGDGGDDPGRGGVGLADSPLPEAGDLTRTVEAAEALPGEGAQTEPGAPDDGHARAAAPAPADAAAGDATYTSPPMAGDGVRAYQARFAPPADGPAAAVEDAEASSPAAPAATFAGRPPPYQPRWSTRPRDRQRLDFDGSAAARVQRTAERATGGTGSASAERGFPHAVTGVAFALAICALNYVLVLELLKGVFERPGLIAAGVVLAGFFALFAPSPLLGGGRTEQPALAAGPEVWRLRFIDVGMPVTTALFIAVWAVPSAPAGVLGRVVLFLFLAALFFFVGRLLVRALPDSGPAVRRALGPQRERLAGWKRERWLRRVVHTERGWLLSDRARLLARADLLEAEIMHTCDQIRALPEADEIDAVRDHRLALFRSEIELARHTREAGSVLASKITAEVPHEGL